MGQQSSGPVVKKVEFVCNGTRSECEALFQPLSIFAHGIRRYFLSLITI
jgi:hypothetical protein